MKNDSLQKSGLKSENSDREFILMDLYSR